MDRRAWVLSSSVLAAVAVAWTAAVSVWTHASQWSIHRADLRHLAHLRVTDPTSAATWPALPAPHVGTDVLLSVDPALPLVAAAALGVALVAAGHRWWALAVPVALNAAAGVGWNPLGGLVLLPADVTSGSAAPSPWWPWDEVALQAVVTVLPAAAAVLALRGRPAAVTDAARRTGTGVALRRAGTAAAALVLVQVVLSPMGLSTLDAPAWAHAATLVLVVLAAGLVAAGGSRRLLGAGALVLVALAGVRALLRTGLAGDQYVVWGPLDALAGLAGTYPVWLGVFAVLGAPWLGRRWVRLFRPGTRGGTRGGARELPQT